MEDALWSLVAAGVIANAYRSEPRLTSNPEFRSRLRENFLGALVIFLAIFFLGSFILNLEMLDPRLIALNLSDASSRTAPYIAALFVSLLDLMARTLINIYFVARDGQTKTGM